MRHTYTYLTNRMYPKGGGGREIVFKYNHDVFSSNAIVI